MKTIVGLVLLLLLCARAAASDCLSDVGLPTAAEIQAAMAATGAMTAPTIHILKDACWPRENGLAFYNPERAGIYLREDWRHREGGMAVFVHEMRHNWQWETGRDRQMSSDQRECDAYSVAARYAGSMPGSDWRRWARGEASMARAYCGER